MGADELVRVGIVRDDVAAAGNAHRLDGVGRNPDGPGEFDGAVLVGVFEANVENRRLFAAIETFFKLFFADTFDGHGAILAVPPADVKVGALGASPLRLALGLGSHRHHHLLADAHVPPVRPLAAVIAAQINGVGFAGDGEVVAARQIAGQPVPHIGPLCFRLSNLFYRKLSADLVNAQCCAIGRVIF